MNEILQGTTRAIAASIPTYLSLTPLAQVGNQVGNQVDNAEANANNFLGSLGLGTSIGDLIRAIVILVVGLIVAALASAIVRGILNRTSIDNRLGRMVTRGRVGQSDTPSIEKLVADLVFWVIVIFTVVACLQALSLTAVSAPLNNFLNQVIGYLPKLLGAAIVLGLAWLIATVVKQIVTRALEAAGVDERLGQHISPSTTPTPASPTGYTASTPAYPDYPQDPPPGTTGLTMSAPPPSNQFSLSESIGNTAYWFILLLFLPTILERLELQGTLAPIQNLIDIILAAIPRILTAAVTLAIAYFFGQFLARLVTSLLTRIGFNNILYWLGIQANPITPSQVPPPVQTAADLGRPRIPVQTVTVPRKTPSEIVGIIVLVGVLLVAALPAADVLNLPALTSLVTGIVAVAGQILAGLVVFAIGLYFANLAYSLITSSAGRQSKILGQVARISIIALVSAMALRQIGVASDIVNLAFGLLLGAVAVAIALAFGLGGRDVAGEQLREWLASFRNKQY